MDVSRRRGGVRSSVVAAGSVWESRMKLDEVKGGIKVFNGGGDDSNQEEGNADSPAAKRTVKKAQTQNFVGGVGGVSGKRKTWKSEGNTIQIAKSRSDSDKNSEEQCKEISVSVDGVKRSPTQTRKGKFEGSKELSLSGDGIERSPIQKKKGRSEGSRDVGVASGDGNVRSPIQVRKPRSGSIELCKDVEESSLGVVERNSDRLSKVKSGTNKVLNQSGNNLGHGEGAIERNSVQITRAESEPNRVLKESGNSSSNGDSADGIVKNPDEIEKEGSDYTSKEFGVCLEKAILSNVSNVGMVKPPPDVLVDDGDDLDDADEEFEEEEDEEVESEIEKSIDVKEINLPEKKPDKVVNEEKTPNKVVKEVKRVHQFNNRTAPTPPTVTKQPPPVRKRATIYENLPKPTSVPVSNGYQSFPQTQSKLQSLVDLVMWRDISRSAFVFGIGTFIIISSSYTKDLNISFISVISYLGLVYLAAIFLYRSIICRGVIDIDDPNYVVGEEEGIWLLKLILPYINEFLLKLKALFSGDPATTMKLAVILFVLARSGNSITIWKMAKLGFLGVFTVPKVCSSYSTQLTAYGKFWVQRFGDTWESCAHKKAVGFAIFSLVWNLSSIVARIWAVFMLFVAVRYYHHSLGRDEWAEDDEAGEDTWDGQIGEEGQGRGPTSGCK